MFNPLQQVYIDSLRKQLEEANEVIKDVDHRRLYYSAIYGCNQAWHIFRAEKLKEYQKKYNIQGE